MRLRFFDHSSGLGRRRRVAMVRIGALGLVVGCARFGYELEGEGWSSQGGLDGSGGSAGNGLDSGTAGAGASSSNGGVGGASSGADAGVGGSAGFGGVGGAGGTATGGTGGAGSGGGGATADAGGGAGGASGAGGTGGSAGTPDAGGSPDNAPPVPQLLVTPGLGWHDGLDPTVFVGDATGTTDADEGSASLSYSWDWNADGVEDDSGVISNHVYSAPGSYDVRLSVTDSAGAVAYRTFLVVVESEANVVSVTTPGDESDVGATPGSPGGAGLSLREAIAHAASLGPNATVFVPAGTDIVLSNELVLANTVTLVGDGASLDGSNGGGGDSCLRVDANDVRIFGFEIHDCKRYPVRVEFVTGVRLARLNVHDNPLQVLANGSDNVFGPDNEVSFSASHGISVVGQWRVERSHFHDNLVRGIDLDSGSAQSVIVGNLLTRNDPGIALSNASTGALILHNVCYQNDSSGLLAGSSATSHVIQNNVFANNGTFGVAANDSAFATLSHNAFFGNASGACSGCTTLGAGTVTLPPEFTDPGANDFSLLFSSPLINAGTPTSEDVNGPAPGAFNGAAPDIGAFEAP